MSRNKPPPLPTGVRLGDLSLIAWRCEQAIEREALSNTHMTPHLAEKLAPTLSGITSTPPVYLYQSLLSHDGKRLSVELCQYLGRQLAGRRTELRNGPIAPCVSPRTNGWIIVQVVGVKEAAWGDRGLGYQLSLACRYGPPSGVTLQRKVPAGYLRWFAYQVGFTRRMAYNDDPRVFMGLMFWVYTTVLPDGEGYEIEACDASSALRKHNTEIIKKRLRFYVTMRDDPCPYTLPNDCANCAKVDCNGHYDRYNE